MNHLTTTLFHQSTMFAYVVYNIPNSFYMRFQKIIVAHAYWDSGRGLDLRARTK